jgi:hypothetical protein
MTKKPRLTIVDPEQTTAVTLVTPPPSLNKAGRTLWQNVMSEYDIHDSGGQQMLQQICEVSDRVAEFSAVIKRDGPVVRIKHGPKDHPLLKHEQAARSFIVRSLARLGLDVEPVKTIGRPSLGIGWTGYANKPDAD